MILGSEHLSPFLRIATVVAPVGLYFLILGLLNTRRHPQLLSGRQDFSVLILALSPLFVVPVMNYVGPSVATLLVVAAVLAAGIWLLAPTGRTWVIYNMQGDQARSAVRRALRMIGVHVESQSDTLRLDEHDATMRISEFPLLRNVTVRIVGGSEEFTRRFGNALSRTLASRDAETSSMAVALLLVATAMLVAPLALVAHRVPEIVRIVTDLLNQ